MPKEFLLVHGACHGAWCWDEVAERLRARGHRVAAVDLPGHGRRAAEMRRASVASYAAAVADALAAEGMSHAVVVGHSMGGLVIPKAADMRVFHGLRVPRTYIRCLEDRAVVPSLTAQCAARLGVTPVDMDCAHNAMLSRPDELCHALEHVEP